MRTTSTRIHPGNIPGTNASMTLTSNRTAAINPTARRARRLPDRAERNRSGSSTANSITITPCTQAPFVAAAASVTDRTASATTVATMITT